MSVDNEWILKVRSVNGKKEYVLMHECIPKNYSSTIVSGSEGRKCFACGKEAPQYKSMLVDLSK